MRKILTDKTCKYFNNLRILLKRGLKPEWDRSRVRELTTLIFYQLPRIEKIRRFLGTPFMTIPIKVYWKILALGFR